jgi:hypothetical protein
VPCLLAASLSQARIVVAAFGAAGATCKPRPRRAEYGFYPAGGQDVSPTAHAKSIVERGGAANKQVSGAVRSSKDPPGVHKGMNERAANIPQQGKVRLPDSLQRLVDFYTVTGQAEKADEWRAKLEAARPKEPVAPPPVPDPPP